MTPSTQRSGTRPTRGASAAAAAAALLLAAGCASDTAGRPDVQRPESMRPAGVDVAREAAEERRTATRALMDQQAVRPDATGGPSAAGETADSVLGFLGDAGGFALDVVALRALGLW